MLFCSDYGRTTYRIMQDETPVSGEFFIAIVEVGYYFERSF